MFDEAVFVVAVTSVGEVTQQGVDLTDLQRCRPLDDLVEARVDISLDPRRRTLAVAEPAAIVVASDEDLAAAELTCQRERVGDFAECEVAEDPDRVVRADHLVPVGDELTVHLVNVGERTIAVFDDVAVAEVQIGSEPGRHDVTRVPEFWRDYCAARRAVFMMSHSRERNSTRGCSSRSKDLGSTVMAHTTDLAVRRSDALCVGGDVRQWTDGAGAGCWMRPSGVVTFLFSDVEGSTRHWDADADAMSASLRLHDAVVREAIEQREGYVFATGGDSFAAAFARASSAVEAAAALQDSLGQVPWPGPELRVRVGLHLGEAEERDGDYFGPAVNATARVEAAGHGGQTLLTDAVRVAARAAATTDLGIHSLRDLDEPLHLHQLGDMDFPPLRVSADSPPKNTSHARSWLVLHQPGQAPETVDLSTELTIGRNVGLPAAPGHLAMKGDPTVSRLHAVLEPRATGWSVQATSAANGLFVNGTRLAPGSVYLLAPDDEFRLGERTRITFHTVLAESDDRSKTETARSVPDLTPGERRVLLCLCSPVLDGDTFTPPATVSAIASELFVTESAVKQQLGRLYTKFEIDEGTDRRLRLANEALTCGAVRLADLQSQRESQ